MLEPDDDALRARFRHLTRSVERQVVVPEVSALPRRSVASVTAAAALVAALLMGVGIATGGLRPEREQVAPPPVAAGGAATTEVPTYEVPPVPTAGAPRPTVTPRRPKPPAGAASTAPRTSASGPRVSPPGPPVRILAEDFSSDSAAGRFHARGGTWVVVDGRYRLYEPAEAGAGNANLAVHTTPVGGEVVIEATLTAYESEDGWADASLVFGYRDPGDYYYLSVNQDNDADTSGIFRVVDGIATELADVAVGVVDERPYLVRVEVAGGRVRAFLGGVLVAEARASVPSGRVGFGTRNNRADFDSLTVTRR